MQSYQNELEYVKKKAAQPVNMTNTGSPVIRVLDSVKLMEIAEEGLANMILEVGLEAVRQIFEQDVEEIVGPKSKHNKNRTANRHGTEQTKVTLSDRKINVRKPRVRSNGHDIPLPSLSFFQSAEPMNKAILTRLLCGISTRKYGRTVADGDMESVSVSKSEVSRRFNTELKRLMDEFFNRRLDKDYPCIMVDGMERGGMVIIVALGITSDGRKEILGMVEGGTENSEAVKRLFNDIIERGLRTDTPRLYTLDGAKALAKAVRDTFGDMALVQRCQVHKKRNVMSHLPQSEQANVGLALSLAYLEHDYDEALGQLNIIADSLEHRYPSAAASIREGLEETLTVHRLKVPGLLRKTLSSTNAMESANAIAASVTRRISKWKNGEMLLRQMAAGFLEAERGFHRIQGYKQLPLLMSSLYVATTNIKKTVGKEVAV